MGFKSRPISLSGRAWDVSDCARPFVFSAPFQCSTKQGREELLTAAVERAHSDCARSGSTGPSWVSFPILIRRTRFEWNLRYLNAGWPGAASDCARPTRRFCFFTFSIGDRRTILHCEHRTSTASSCAFCEQEGWLPAPSHPSERASSNLVLARHVFRSILCFEVTFPDRTNVNHAQIKEG